MASNINAVSDLVLSQEDAPQSHRTTRQIHRETSVMRIIDDDLQWQWEVLWAGAVEVQS